MTVASEMIIFSIFGAPQCSQSPFSICWEINTTLWNFETPWIPWGFTPWIPWLLHPHIFLNFFSKSIQVHLSLKLLVAHLGARSYTEAAAKMAFDIDTTTTTVMAQALAEREMDLQLPGVGDSSHGGFYWQKLGSERAWNRTWLHNAYIIYICIEINVLHMINIANNIDLTCKDAV